ncbi:chitin synthase 6 [Sugiyamaella lignohabitans]|uniref:Chitin synthase 6 n=1 Tax=Sugiyamaella lignohabitans TaxID=796027 RepID=A0A161HGB8_9ASCO|nr:chitin synthase 6 [Sugiyamaella lignohabitans]ANB11791.1 chitin synthase 6 [Sugiyamaella lignohabitans]
MDNFSWGNTRIVVEENAGKRKLKVDPNEVFDPRSVPLESWQSYANRNNLPGEERRIVFDDRKGRVINNVEYTDYGYDMQDLSARKSVMFDAATETRSTRPFSQFSMDINRVGTPTTAVGGEARSLRLSLAPTELLDDQAQFDEHREVQVRETIKTVLRGADLDTMTKRQLRQKVEDILGMDFVGNKVAAVDRLIDEELESMENEESEIPEHPPADLISTAPENEVVKDGPPSPNIP